jgi:hypothetical protein
MPMVNNSKSHVIEINMENVESSTLFEPGNYRAEVKGVTEKTSQSGNQMLVWVFKVYDTDSSATCNIYHNTSLQPQALFNLKNVLIALGVDVPNGTMEIDLNDYPGATCGVTLDQETYNQKTKNKITAFFPLTEEMGIEG